MRANTDFIKSLATSYAESLQGKHAVDVVSFANASWGLNIQLLPVQKFILKVFYGMKLNDYDVDIDVFDDCNDKSLYKFSEKDFLNYLMEEKRCNITEYKEQPFRKLMLCIGRRGSKSTIASVIANYEVYKLLKLGNPQEYYGFPAGHEICITSVATSDSQAGALFDMVKNRGMNCTYIKDRLLNVTQSYYNVQTDFDIKEFGKKRKASIYLVCSGSSSTTLRGRNNIVVILDEAAYFLDNDGRYSGTEVYKALTPSILTFKPKARAKDEAGDGKIILLSSPFSKSGLFWDEYQRSFMEEDSTLMFRMYTSMLNPLVDTMFLKSEKRRNKVTFNCEYGGEFSDVVSNWVDDEERFGECVDTTVKANKRQGLGHIDYYMGLDLGLKNDGTGITIVHREKEGIVLDWSEVYYSGSSDVWEYPDSMYKDCKEMSGYEIIPVVSIVEKIKYLCRQFPIKSGWFDQYNGYALYELLQNEGLRQFDMRQVTDGMNTEVFQIVKMLYVDKLLKLFDHPVLIRELKSLQEEKRGRTIKVQAFQRPGAHDDISCSFTRAVYECYKQTTDKPRNMILSMSKDGSDTGRSGLGAYKFFHNKKMVEHGGPSTRMSISKADKHLRRIGNEKYR